MKQNFGKMLATIGSYSGQTFFHFQGPILYCKKMGYIIFKITVLFIMDTQENEYVRHCKEIVVMHQALK